MEKAQNALRTNSSPPIAPTADPLPNLVQSRFRLLRECADCDDRDDNHAIERRVDEVQRRARKLDERIVRTVATSILGILAQVRLLAAFYEESLNGAGRRGSLLIQTITAGIERLDRPNQPRYRTTGTRGTRKSGSTETAFSATRKTAINGGVNTKRVRPMKVNEFGSGGPTEPEDLFEMANLYPSTTGLPMTVWVSPRGNARHDVRVRVNITDGDQIDIADTAVVVVRPTPCVIAGQLSPAGAQAVFRWISLNTDALVAYWEGQIDTVELCQMLKPLPAQQTMS